MALGGRHRALRLVTAPASTTPPPVSQTQPVSGRRRVERLAQYRLHGLIARGGMATVWRATGPDGAEVAIKRMLPALAENPRAVISFSDEALLGMRIRHPRLVHTFELGVFEKQPFLVMELVPGPSVAEVLNRSQTLMRPAAAVHIVEQLLEALSVLHELRDDDGDVCCVVHRDVAPNNLLLTLDGEVKLGDYGIAQIIRAGVPSAPAAMQGKVGYMAPEQLAGGALDARTDLFAAGVVLLELLTGRRAFARDHEVATLAANYGGYARGIDASVPGPLAAVVRKALAQRREDRFSSAQVFARALAEARGALGLRSGREQLARFLCENADTLHPGLRSTVRPISNTRRVADAHPPSLPAGAGIESRLAGRVARAARALATGRIEDCDASLALGLERRRDMLAFRFGEPGEVRPCGPISPSHTRAVLRELAARRASGLLVARSGPRETRVFFDEGAPIFIASNADGELLGERLVRAGRATPSDVELAVERASRWDCQLGEALVDSGVASARSVFGEIREQMRARLRELGAWTDGELGFVEHARPGLAALRLRLDDFDFGAT